MTGGFVFHVWTLGNRARNSFIIFDVERGQSGPVGRVKQKRWGREKTCVSENKHCMLHMWLDLLRWIVSGLMSSFTHTASFCLHAAWPILSFSSCTCVSIPYLLTLWSPFTSTVKALGERFSLSFLKTLGKEKSCTNNRCVLWSQATFIFFKEWYVPNPLRKLDKGDILKDPWWSFVQLLNTGPPSCVGVLKETFCPKLLLRY